MSVEFHCPWHRNYCGHACEDCVRSMEKGFDQLRAENEKLRAKQKDIDLWMAEKIGLNLELQTKLADAVGVIDAIDHELGRPRLVEGASFPAPVVNASDLARAFLSKLKGEG